MRVNRLGLRVQGLRSGGFEEPNRQYRSLYIYIYLYRYIECGDSIGIRWVEVGSSTAAEQPLLVDQLGEQPCLATPVAVNP